MFLYTYDLQSFFFSVHEALKMLIANTPHTAAPAPAAAHSAPPPPRPAGLLPPVPGTPDSIATVKELPQRYRRRALALEEIDYIQVRAGTFTLLLMFRRTNLSTAV